jgi:uncharacterized protein (TIGR03067 family)
MVKRPLALLVPVVIGFALIVTAGPRTRAQEDAAQADLKRLQGTWLIESVEQGGKKTDVLAGGKMVFTENEHSIRRSGAPENTWAKGAHKIDTSQSPKHFDIDPRTGPNVGKTHLGIYEIDGDRCRICFADPPTDDRPAEFKSKDGTHLVLLVLKRLGRPQELHSAEKNGVKSVNSNSETKIKFLNTSKRTIKVYWLDFEGDRQPYGTLKDGDSIEPVTYLTHPWLITDEKDNPWYIYFPDAQPRIVEIVAP